jgi:DNA-binding CsgD family transcriptional regulator
MSKRKFTDEQEQEICRRYLQGESTVQLGKALGVDPATINNILKCNGVQRRSAIVARGGLPPEVEPEVCRRYLQGESTIELSKALGVSPTNIRNILKRNGVQRRSAIVARGGLLPEAEAEVCRRYQQGESTIELSREFSVRDTTIGNVLKRNHIERRSAVIARGGLYPEAEAEVCFRYRKGETTHQLGAAFGVSQPTICKILERNRIQRRTGSEARGGVPPEFEPEICRRYLEGEDTSQLSVEFDVHGSTIVRLLKRNGVQIRTHSETMGGVSPEFEPEICRRYLEGEGTRQLSVEFDVCGSTIAKLLKRNGVQLRPGGGLGDSVQDALNSTGRHREIRDCEFYLFELSRYSDTHCKPGIAFDAETRIAQGGGEYGSEILRLFFSTRAEAFILEQAVLDQTKGCADCPDDLWDWSGASEVRAMPAEDMVPIVLRLADELEEMGVWSFAAAYLPMTAAQRMQCQQRAQRCAEQEVAA